MLKFILLFIFFCKGTYQILIKTKHSTIRKKLQKAAYFSIIKAFISKIKARVH